jgi:Flp pilus assembly pilin Flp
MDLAFGLGEIHRASAHARARMFRRCVGGLVESDEICHRGALRRSSNWRRLHMSDTLLRPIIAMQVAVHQLREREDGQTTTEYAILLGFLAIAIIIALFFLRNVLRNLFSTAASSVSRAPN